MSNALVQVDRDYLIPPAVDPFDYGALSPEQVTVVQTAAHLIRRHLSNTVDAIIDAGQHLKQVKEILGHGSFGKWLATEFALTERTAQLYMRAAEVYAGKSETVSHLPVGLLYQVQAPTISDEVRAEILADAERAPIPEDEIKARLSFARAEARRKAADAVKDRKLSPLQRKRRKARLDRQKHDWAAEREAQEREENRRAELTQSAADHVLLYLDAGARVRLRELLNAADAWRFKEALLSACEPEGSQ